MWLEFELTYYDLTLQPLCYGDFAQKKIYEYPSIRGRLKWKETDYY